MMLANGSRQRCGLTEIVFWSMAGAAALAISIQTALCFYDVYYEDYYFSRRYVSAEAKKIIRGAHLADGELTLDLDRRLAHYTDHADRYAYRIAMPDGKLLAGSNVGLIEPYSPLRGRPEFLPELWLYDVYLPRQFHIAGGMALWVDGQKVWVEVATLGDPALVREGVIAVDLLDDVGIPLLPLTVLSMTVATLAVRRSLRPLVAAALQADGIAAGDREARFSLSDLPREAASFAGAINRLMDRVGELVQSQKFFLSHAAHELRTPLAIMLLELGKIRDPAARRLEADVAVMSDIVDRLLVLARIDAQRRPDRAEIDLAETGQQVVDRLRPLAEAKGSKLALSIVPPATFRGDLTSVYEALRNLVENAIRHTPPGSTVQVTCGPGGHLVVEDDGPGLPKAKEASLFEPFRKGSTICAGAGLGLSIVKRAVELHDGSIEAGKSRLGGARFSVRFFPRNARMAVEQVR